MEKMKAGWFEKVKLEFSKISWLSKDDVIKQIIAVVFSSVVIGSLVALMDLVIRFGIEKLVTFPG